MRITTFTENIFSPEGGYSFIHDWYTMAAVLRIRPQILSYTLMNMRVREKDDDVHAQLTKIRIKNRTVYKSSNALRRIQEELLALLAPLVHGSEYDHILAYVKGKSYVKELKECTGYKYMVICDIQKYFDNITFDMIVDTLKAHGFSHAGAKLITRYCVVPGRGTLQQGSAVSSVISNLVGYHVFDKVICAWLYDRETEDKTLKVKYVRYCDNLALFLDGKKLTLDFIQKYRDMVVAAMAKSKFRTHKWGTVPNNSPVRKQKFLGMVLNHTARVEKENFLRVRAALFNACTQGPVVASGKYAEMHVIKNAGILRGGSSATFFPDYTYAAFCARVNGDIQYIGSINATHGHALRKLQFAMEFLTKTLRKEQMAAESVHSMLEDRQRAVPASSAQLPEPVMLALKTYRNTESITLFGERLLGAVNEVLAEKNVAFNLTTDEVVSLKTLEGLTKKTVDSPA